MYTDHRINIVINYLLDDKKEEALAELGRMKMRRDTFLANLYCAKCHKEVFPISDSFMVHDHIWAEAGMGKKGYLHLDCLEYRLGRFLKFTDFPDIPVNRGILFAKRISDA